MAQRQANEPSTPRQRRVTSLQPSLSFSSSPTSSPPRSEKKKELASSRDKRCCVLTRIGEITEVAHIYPYSMGVVPKNGSFWTILSIFWSKDLIMQWQESLFTENRTEICENLITLSPGAHECWTASLFALKPLSIAEDQREMEVQFFWLRKYTRMPAVPATRRPVLSQNGENLRVGLYNWENNRKIRSGDKFTLCTDDPKKKPLPSFHLLQMQWILHRLTALIGKAEDIDFNEDDESDYDTTCCVDLDSLEMLNEIDEDQSKAYRVDLAALRNSALGIAGF